MYASYPFAPIRLGEHERTYVAREVERGAEYEHLRTKAVDVYIGYAIYIERVARLTIPILLLEVVQRGIDPIS